MTTKSRIKENPRDRFITIRITGEEMQSLDDAIASEQFADSRSGYIRSVLNAYLANAK